jgi:hypothetical protein
MKSFNAFTSIAEIEFRDACRAHWPPGFNFGTVSGVSKNKYPPWARILVHEKGVKTQALREYDKA